MAKKSPSLVPDFGSFDPIQAANFFLQKSGSSVTRCHGQLSSCTISEKTNDPILRKVSDGQTDGQTNKSDFIGCCPTNVKHPTMCTEDQFWIYFFSGKVTIYY